MRSDLRWFGLVTLLMLTVVSPASADDSFYRYFRQRNDVKTKTRWSLQEWLDTRDRMRLMDLWLAFHSPSPYEFYVGGEWRSLKDAGGGPSYGGLGVQAAAYASIFGLEGRYRTGEQPDTQAWMNLRVFGYHAQGTNITLQGGLRRTERAGVGFRNAAAGVSTTIYLGRHFGIEGLYRHHFASVPNGSGDRLSGSQYEAGAFIDFQFLRVFGSWQLEPREYRSPGGAVVERDLSRGVVVGTKLWF